MTDHQVRDDDDVDDEIDSLDDDVELESFLDVMEQKDESRDTELTARRQIEDLLEERRLRQLLDDYPDFDEEE